MQHETIAKFRIEHPRITKFFEIINNLASQNLVRFLFIPIVYALPVFLINSSFSNSSLAKFIIENFGAFGSFIVAQQAWIIIIAFIIYAIFSYLFSYVKIISEYIAPQPPDLSKQHAISIIQTLEIIVQTKYKRFINTLKMDISADEIFNTITQPNLQKEIIIQAIKSHLEIQFPNTLIKVGLMRISNKMCTEWENYLPSHIGPKTPISVLNSKTSCIKRSIENKTLIIVENTSEEVNKSSNSRCYINGMTPEIESGSQICFPILHPLTNEVIYVLAVSCNRVNSFKNEDFEFYQWLLGVFTQRILLEISLEILKNSFQRDNNHAA